MMTLWSCEHCIVVDKPPGLLVHNSAWAGPPERTLTDMVRESTAEPCVPVHRLDRGTSGALVFARSSTVAAIVTASVADVKHYLAIVRGRPVGPLSIDHPLDDDDVPGSPRKASRSRLLPVASSLVERVSLVVMTLWTGRRHQARRHCKHVSHPIIGDATHGKGPINRDLAARYALNRLALHAWRISVDDVTVVAPLPADWLQPLAALFGGVDVVSAAEAALAGAPPEDRPEGLSALET
jgi:tRNA pseudouridine65 synthase